LSAMQAAARALDIDLNVLEIHAPDQLDAALRAVISSGSRGVAMLSSPLMRSTSQQIAEFTLKQRLPAISPFRTFPDSGGLMSYGPEFHDFFRRSAGYADKILRGAKPGDLPIEQPTKFEFVINLKTAKAFGLTMPQSLVVRANEVIQ